MLAGAIATPVLGRLGSGPGRRRVVLATLAVPSYIGTEAGLSFLGVGVMPPTPSWGQMISTAVGWYAVDPMYFLIPGTFLFLLVLSFTVLGDRLKDIVDAGERR